MFERRARQLASDSPISSIRRESRGLQSFFEFNEPAARISMESTHLSAYYISHRLFTDDVRRGLSSWAPSPPAKKIPVLLLLFLNFNSTTARFQAPRRAQISKHPDRFWRCERPTRRPTRRSTRKLGEREPEGHPSEIDHSNFQINKTISLHLTGRLCNSVTTALIPHPQSSLKSRFQILVKVQLV